ncbi:alanine--tRNA ligase, cytoplasmic-like isoform X2 [Lineus longissimus]
MLQSLKYLGRRVHQESLTWSLLQNIQQKEVPGCLLQGRRLYTVSPSDGRHLTSKKIRQMFIDFFKDEYDHVFVPSSSVIPKKGEGTYFVNAGMNQFKPIFLGTVDPSSEMAKYKRVVNSQKCVRLGGKHNDLCDVGMDGYHHTFFEMLGSWSFSDYFKDEACEMAWKLLTEVYNLPNERLYITYFGGDKKLGLQPDMECKEAWLKLGIPASRVIPSGMKDNFWMMGHTGPCGPCSEIHYDHIGDRDATSLVNAGSPDVIELWNLVFMQFDRQSDQSLLCLPCKHVDTGMGLERITAVLQGKTSNYDTDLFQPIFHQIQKMCKTPPYEGQYGASDTKGLDTAYRIIADHSRMAAVAIADGLMPGRAKLENKLHQILHRNLKQAHTLLRAPRGMLAELVPVIVDILGEAFPELKEKQRMIIEVMNTTEEKYLSQMESGRKVMEKALVKMNIVKNMTADQIWQLHDGSYGHSLSLDLIRELAVEKGINLDMKGLEKKLDSLKEQSKLQVDQRNLGLRLDQHLLKSLIEKGAPPTNDFSKYEYSCENGTYNFPVIESSVLALLSDGKLVDSVDDGMECGVILDRTNFYAEAGGQVADKGNLKSQDFTFIVRDVQQYQKYILHTGVSDGGGISVGDRVQLHIDEDHRVGCMCNHTATHMVNHALRQVFKNVHQKGSVVTSDRLSFDFNCLETVDRAKIAQIQETVDELIRGEYSTHRETLPLDVAMGLPGLCTLQDEVYPQDVNVISIGADVSKLLEPGSEAIDCSVELCGGTHVHNTGDIVSLVITKLLSIAQGTKRVVAVTGKTAIEALESADDLQRLFEDLQHDIQSGSNPDSWADQLKGIDTIFSTCVLPKLEKDHLWTEVDLVRQRVRTHTNQQVKEHIRKTIQSFVETTNDVIVREFPLDDIPMVSQVLSKMKVEKPILLTSCVRTQLKVIAYIPNDNNNESRTWLEHSCSELKDFRITKVKGKKTGQLFNAVSSDVGGLQSVLDKGIGHFSLLERKTR